MTAISVLVQIQFPLHPQIEMICLPQFKKKTKTTKKLGCIFAEGITKVLLTWQRDLLGL